MSIDYSHCLLQLPPTQKYEEFLVKFWKCLWQDFAKSRQGYFCYSVMCFFLVCYNSVLIQRTANSISWFRKQKIDHWHFIWLDNLLFIFPWFSGGLEHKLTADNTRRDWTNCQANSNETFTEFRNLRCLAWTTDKKFHVLFKTWFKCL